MLYNLDSLRKTIATDREKKTTHKKLQCQAQPKTSIFRLIWMIKWSNY